MFNPASEYATIWQHKSSLTMKPTSFPALTSCLIALGLSMSAATGTVIISHSFDGVANDTGPSWTAGGWGNGSTGNATTGALSVTSGNNNYRANLNTSSRFFAVPRGRPVRLP